MNEAQVELLLQREARSKLPLVRQCLLYLDPFSLFKDASRGPAQAREKALSYNRSLRWVLLHYLRRWLAIALSLFVAVMPAEAMAAQLTILPTALLAVGSCIALTVAALTLGVYLLLGIAR